MLYYNLQTIEKRIRMDEMYSNQLILPKRHQNWFFKGMNVYNDAFQKQTYTWSQYLFVNNFEKM